MEHAAVLGAGGTAAAAAVALASLGARQVDVVVREPARAADLLRVLEALGVAAEVQRLDRADLGRAPVVVSTVPVDGQPAVADLAWRPGQTVLDVLYAGWPTPLAQRVDRAGGTVDQRPRGAVLAGHRPGRADDRAARADRGDARRAGRLTGPVPSALTLAGAVVGLLLGPWLAGSPRGWPPGTPRPGPRRSGSRHRAAGRGAVARRRRALPGAGRPRSALAWFGAAAVVLAASTWPCTGCPTGSPIPARRSARSRCSPTPRSPARWAALLRAARRRRGAPRGAGHRVAAGRPRRAWAAAT